jgi:hypothetical protein
MVKMTNRNFFFGAAILLGLVFSTSCKRTCDDDLPDSGFKSATVVYGGAPEVDGCGWKILIDSVFYHPVNLDLDYQIADLTILIKYTNDPEEFRCGRGGILYPSIKITEIKKDAKEVGFLKDDEWKKYSMDPFRLDSAYVKDDWLFMKVSYSGGCKEHELNLWKLPPNALVPPPIELALSHNANDDMCEAYLTRWLVFSLVPLRENGKKEISFLLRGSPEMSAYFGQFEYKY